MKKHGELKNILMLAGLYISTVIGAGFASGQEILSFFVVYGKKSAPGLVLVSIIFALCGSCVMYRVYRSKLNNFGEYMQHIAGKKTAAAVELCTVLFMFAGFSSMAAGSGALMQNYPDWHYIYGVLIMIALCSLVFLFDLKGILAVNAILAPVLCIGLITLGISAFLSHDAPVFASDIITWVGSGTLIKNWLVSAIIYSAYNMLTTVVVLADTRSLIHRGRSAVGAGVVGGGVLGIIALIIWAAIGLYYGKTDLGEIPLLAIVSRQGRLLEHMYSAILMVAMFTTAVSFGYGFLSRLKDILGYRSNSLVLILGLITIPVALLGFSGIVQSLYTLFGYLGIPLVVLILRDGVRMARERRR